jgi:hypothetical protein
VATETGLDVMMLSAFTIRGDFVFSSLLIDNDGCDDEDTRPRLWLLTPL